MINNLLGLGSQGLSVDQTLNANIFRRLGHLSNMVADWPFRRTLYFATGIVSKLSSCSINHVKKCIKQDIQWTLENLQLFTGSAFLRLSYAVFGGIRRCGKML